LVYPTHRSFGFVIFVVFLYYASTLKDSLGSVVTYSSPSLLRAGDYEGEKERKQHHSHFFYGGGSEYGT